jgi:hypothetical protein
MFENRMKRKIFGPKGEATGGWISIQNGIG